MLKYQTRVQDSCETHYALYSKRENPIDAINESTELVHDDVSTSRSDITRHPWSTAETIYDIPLPS